MAATWSVAAAANAISSMRMKRIVLRIVLLLALAAPLVAQKAPDGDVAVRIETTLGNIDIAVDATHAPATAGNFLKYVDGHFYDGGRFHRATRPDNYTPQLPDRPPFQIV